MGTNLSSKYSQKLLYSAKKSTTDALKTASKRVIQKTAEATGNLSVNKIADKITKKSSKELHSKELHLKEANNEVPKKRYISPKKDSKLLMNYDQHNII